MNKTQGQAYVHKDFNLISKGDFIQKKGHVMIATGKVVKDPKTGKVTWVQTVEAHDTDEGSEVCWRKVEKQYTIGHPFRKTDHGALIPGHLQFIGGHQWYVPDSYAPKHSSDAKTRTTDNMQQERAKDKNDMNPEFK